MKGKRSNERVIIFDSLYMRGDLFFKFIEQNLFELMKIKFITDFLKFLNSKNFLTYFKQQIFDFLDDFFIKMIDHLLGESSLSENTEETFDLIN